MENLDVLTPSIGSFYLNMIIKEDFVDLMFLYWLHLR